jgi:hypothetical protein
MQQTFKGFIYMVAGKLATIKDTTKRWFTFDSVALSKEQFDKVVEICDSTSDLQYLSIIQSPTTKVIGLCTQGKTEGGMKFVTDNVNINIMGQILNQGNFDD